jgi:diguanylate cyclase (GGDEF)-like protein/PAS domain S-box-containing protein/putative nucleotidyltransferase with HDIG domain
LEKTYQDLLEHAPVACLNLIVLHDSSIKIGHVNRRFNELFGSKDDFMKSEFFIAQLLPHIDQASRTPHENMHTIITCQGKTYQTMVRASSNGFLVYIDDTAFTKQEGYVYASYHLLIDGFVFLIKDMRIIDVLVKDDMSLFKPKNELIGHSIDEVFYPDHAKQFRNAIDRVIETKQKIVVDYRSPVSDDYYRATLQADEPYVIMSVKDITKDRLALEQKRKEQERYIELGKHARTYAFEVDLNGKYTYVDENVFDILGYQASEVIDKRYFYDSLAPEIRENIKELAFSFFEEHDTIKNMINENIRKDGRRIILSTNAYPVFDKLGSLVGYRGSDQDITDEVEIRRQIEKMRLVYQTLSAHTPIGIVIADQSGRVTYANRYFFELTEEKRERFLGRDLMNINNYDIRALVKKTLRGERGVFEGGLRKSDHTIINIRISATPILDRDKRVNGGIAIVEDVTKELANRKRIKELTVKDSLTTALKRTTLHAFMEVEEHQREAYGIIVCDINGLRHFNNALGLAYGDSILKDVANLLVETIDTDGMVFRTGGDTFSIITYRHTKEHIEAHIHQIIERIRTTKDEKNRYFISFGYSIKNREKSFDKAMAEAEDMMVQNKVLDGSTTNREIIDLLLETLYQKSSRELDHSKRVSELAQGIALNLGLSERDVKRIKLAGLLHDLGKVSLDISLLNKDEEPNEAEWLEIKRHPDYGYRILHEVQGYEKIAKIVHEHHERFDGKGYPSGLQGHEISLGARIVMVADSYDAMVSSRPYRKALTSREAIEEIVRCKYTMYDPKVVDAFLAYMASDKEKSQFQEEDHEK